MTVALDFYTPFSNIIYIYIYLYIDVYIYTHCSGLTVFLILHVHANKEIMGKHDFI